MTAGSVHQPVSFLAFLQQTAQITPEQSYLLTAQNDTDLIAELADQKILTTQHAQYLKTQFDKIPSIDLSLLTKSDCKITSLPEAVARDAQAIALTLEAGQSPIIAMKNPLDFQAIDRVTQAIKHPFVPHLIEQRVLVHLLNVQYCNFDLIDAMADEAMQYLSRKNDTAFIIKLVEGIIRQAYLRNASDIHLEQVKEQLRIRLRVDGELLEHILPFPQLTGYVFRIIKSMASLDVAETNSPQEGGFNITIDDELVNIRLSILPIDNGQSAVLRLLRNDTNVGDLDSTIQQDDVIEKLQRFILAKEGMLLVTGPTGSGKSTSLYSIIKTMNQAKSKIITLEDPIEIRLPRVNQIQIVPERNMDFADALRYSLRQDPDIIMVGEIRDTVTAQIATRSAITGHKLLSTLHTNDVIATIDRLLDLDVDPFILSSALKLILAQRLVRLICPYCVTDYQATDAEKALCEYNAHARQVLLSGLKHGAGCDFCAQTGFLGRRPVFESLVITDKLSTLLAQGNREEFKNIAMQQIQNKRLFDSALNLAAAGITTISEALSLATEMQS